MTMRRASAILARAAAASDKGCKLTRMDVAEAMSAWVRAETATDLYDWCGSLTMIGGGICEPCLKMGESTGTGAAQVVSKELSQMPDDNVRPDLPVPRVDDAEQTPTTQGGEAHPQRAYASHSQPSQPSQPHASHSRVQPPSPQATGITHDPTSPHIYTVRETVQIVQVSPAIAGEGENVLNPEGGR